MKEIPYMNSRCWVLSFTLVAILGFRAFGQSKAALKPEKIEIDKAIIVIVLTDFIEDAKKNGAFYEDKGVISLNICPGDSVGQTRYTLQLLIDNRYEDQPIVKYTYFRNYVVLFDSCRYQLSIPDREEYFKALNEEIGDRVYKRPTKKGRWMTYQTKEGKTVSGMREHTVIRLGEGQQNERVYIVDSDNKFKKLRTL